jgi:hypothetical protein
MKKIIPILVLLIVVPAVWAGNSNQDILGYFDSRLSHLTCCEAFREFVDQNNHIFPQLSGEQPISVRVEKKKVIINQKKVSVGISYVQVYIEAPLEYIQTLLETPEWFQALYSLDRSAYIGPRAVDGTFKARIYKKVPVIPNQEFILSFSSITSGSIWFQRGRLLEDRGNFALRDNLKILEPVQGGVVYREISFVYPLKWWARALSSVVQGTMKKELKQMARALKCTAEKSHPFTEEKAASCWATCF